MDYNFFNFRYTQFVPYWIYILQQQKFLKKESNIILI